MYRSYFTTDRSWQVESMKMPLSICKRVCTVGDVLQLMREERNDHDHFAVINSYKRFLFGCDQGSVTERISIHNAIEWIFDLNLLILNCINAFYVNPLTHQWQQ